MGCKTGLILVEVLFWSALLVKESAEVPDVVINEFELNPPGDESVPESEFVELCNPGATPVDITSWKVVSTHGILITVTIPSALGIPVGGFYVVTHSGR